MKMTTARRITTVSHERPLDLEDCRCPVCLEIFLEPVTLPCTHTFCKDCFLESVDKAALSCPLCRRRVSTWVRANSRNNTLVNEQLWQRIQISFPQQCERRRVGQAPEDEFGVLVSLPTVSQPGELQREYQDQITKLTEEKRALDEEERKASESFIQKLLEEEEEKLREEERRREEDERLAKQLSSQLNPPVVSPHSNGISPIPKKKEVTSGQIERFFSPRQTKQSSICSPISTNISNKENIIVSNLDLDETSTSRTETLQRNQTPKRRTSEREEPDDAEEVVSKRGCYSSFPEGPVLSSTAEHEWEAETLRRQQQEKEDLRLALLLQKELDQEEKRRISDRSKGSPDAYLLRQNQAAGRESRSKTPNKVRRKNSNSSSSGSSSSSDSSSSSSGRGNKQTTLTEMFSSR